MTAISTLRSLVIAQIPEANDLLIDRTLLEVARVFCEYTRAWRSTVTETVTASTLAVALTPPTDGEMVDVVKATLDGAPLDKKTHEQLDEIDSQWRTREGSSSYITSSDSLNEVLIAPLANTTYTNGLSVRVAWKPTLTAVTLDAMLVSKYSDLLVEGTLGKLFIIPDEPWEDASRGAYYTTLFEEKSEAARHAVADGNMQGVGRKVKYGGL